MSTEIRAELLERAKKAGTVAAAHADEVDKNARFPQEALEALRKERLMGVLAPVERGGMAASIEDVAAVCDVLGQSCAATSMVYAMHQIQVGCIVRHAKGSSFFDKYLEELVEKQLLIASATSEAGVGGDTRTSVCAVEHDGDSFKLTKNATVISYGAHADDILITARRAPEAVAGDQVLALVRSSQYTLKQTGGWDTLGMRGTSSLGFLLETKTPGDHILPTPFADISSQTMAPYSHILWANVWLGIATEATRRARITVRSAARKKPGTVPPSASRLAELVNHLHTMRAAIRDATHEYQRRADDPDQLSSLAFAVRMNNLKIASSEAVVDIVSRALLVTGIAGYRYDSPTSVGRLLRDAYSAGVMILNDRLYATNATLLMATHEDSA
jgi:acyl-CoA dehydrogenase